jgi:hypothetical protein
MREVCRTILRATLRSRLDRRLILCAICLDRVGHEEHGLDSNLDSGSAMTKLDLGCRIL